MTWFSARSRAREASFVLLALLASVVWCASALAGGGPDDFGYTWLASTEGGPAYTFETPVGAFPLDLADDDFRTVPLGFNFPFYGDVYSEVEVHSNGGLTFGRNQFISHAHECSSMQPDEPSIYPYWTDLNPEGASTPLAGVYAWTDGDPGQRRFIVEWHEIPLFSVSGRTQFEAKLFEADGHIEFHFLDLDVEGSDKDNGSVAAVGIGSPDGVLIASCDEAALSTGLALGFYPPCEDLDGDGFGICEGDCDDGDPDRNPGVDESCNGTDDDCDGSVPSDEQDGDGDGFRPCEDDCDDTDADLTPEDADGDTRSSCDGDCDDEDATRSDLDVDGDGATGCDALADCDDQDPDRSPFDEDGDGFTSCGGDCNDSARNVAPGAPEPCNGVDDDCNGAIDDNENCGDPVSDDDDATDDNPIAAIPYGCILGSNDLPPWQHAAQLIALGLGLGLVATRRQPRWEVAA